MKKLHFTYEMQIEYSIEVARCNYTIKCVPQNTSRQRVEDYSMSFYPPTRHNMGVDGLKNIMVYGVNEEPHNLFNFKIEGTVITGLSKHEEIINEDLAMIFNHPHGLNVAGKNICEFYNNCVLPEGLSDYEKAKSLMHMLHEKFSYQPCSTNVNTSAEEAFTQGHGVCQDYAHILISLLHLAKLPARYVTGLILGEGASHGWVEVLCDGKWFGLDPTHDREVFDDHIKIGIGRDASDCMINRGIMHGGGLHTQIIKVSVSEQE